MAVTPINDTATFLDQNAVPREAQAVWNLGGAATTVTGIATAGSTQQGAVANPAYTDVTGAASGTMISLLKGIFVQLAAINAKTPAP